MRPVVFFFLMLFQVSLSFAQTECINGFAGAYPCENVDLLHYMVPADFGTGNTNEVWGWTDPLDGKEYVLLGKTNGVAFIDISDPLNPLYLGTLPPHTTNSTWRTLRTYNNYCFVGSEASGHGLQVFDLTRLRNVANAPETFTEDAYYGGFGKCHTLVIDEDNGYLYACGTNTFSGGLHVVNIQNPLAPVIAGGFSLDGYTHEAQVITYYGTDPDYQGHTIVFCYNGTGAANFTIVDATDVSDINLISSTPYSNLGYCHQGWLAPDGRYLLLGDELDEYNDLVATTRTLIWDCLDLDAPIYMGDFMSDLPAIDHNQYIIGNLSYQSNYTAGLRILDITEIANVSLSEVGYFDHYLANDNSVFAGTWMSYPFFASGVIPVGDITLGLFLVKPNFIHLTATDNEICSTESATFSLEISEGFTGPVDIEVTGLPAGFSYSLSSDGVTAPSVVTVTIVPASGSDGMYAFQVNATGLHNAYTRFGELTVQAASSWYADGDTDGYGSPASLTMSCTQPIGYVAVSGDCDDANMSVFPGAPGTQEGLDNNCNGIIDPDEGLPCPDFDDNGIVSTSDLLVLISQMGCTSSCTADLTGDNMVTLSDLLVFLAQFGQTCP